ncbi:MAG: hypothetical protein Q4A66_08285 [Eubacteriales bacterium]|nr:hypothetical protein [Eubacteriales bacterium]
MKRWLCLVLVFSFFAACAAAQSVPSKSTADMVTVTLLAENIPEDSGFAIAPVLDAVAYDEQIKACRAEVTTLAKSESVEEYFGEVKNTEGKVVTFEEIFGEEEVKVHEFMPLVVENYRAEYGKVAATFRFATPYEEGEVVVVLIGTRDAQSGELVWIALEGIGTAEGVQIEFDAASLEAAQAGNAMLAVVSRETEKRSGGR